MPEKNFLLGEDYGWGVLSAGEKRKAINGRIVPLTVRERERPIWEEGKKKKSRTASWGHHGKKKRFIHREQGKGAYSRKKKEQSLAIK